MIFKKRRRKICRKYGQHKKAKEEILSPEIQWLMTSPALPPVHLAPAAWSLSSCVQLQRLTGEVTSKLKLSHSQSSESWEAVSLWFELWHSATIGPEVSLTPQVLLCVWGSFHCCVWVWIVYTGVCVCVCVSVSVCGCVGGGEGVSFPWRVWVHFTGVCG